MSQNSLRVQAYVNPRLKNWLDEERRTRQHNENRDLSESQHINDILTKHAKDNGYSEEEPRDADAVADDMERLMAEDPAKAAGIFQRMAEKLKGSQFNSLCFA